MLHSIKKSDFFVGKSAKKSEHEQIFQKIDANHPVIDPLSDGSPTSKKFPQVSIAQKSLGIDKKTTRIEREKNEHYVDFAA